jgi:hypothetical protein
MLPRQQAHAIRAGLEVFQGKVIGFHSSYHSQIGLFVIRLFALFGFETLFSHTPGTHPSASLQAGMGALKLKPRTSIAMKFSSPWASMVVHFTLFASLRLETLGSVRAILYE